MKNRDVNGYINIDVENLIKWEEPNGQGCLVSDKITKEGYKVGYMYREKPDEDVPDSGWRFLVGNEDDAYMENSNNCHIFSINTVCNYDWAIIPYVHAKAGTAYIRTTNLNLKLIKEIRLFLLQNHEISQNRSK